MQVSKIRVELRALFQRQDIIDVQQNVQARGAQLIKARLESKASSALVNLLWWMMDVDKEIASRVDYMKSVWEGVVHRSIRAQERPFWIWFLPCYACIPLQERVWAFYKQGRGRGAEASLAQLRELERAQPLEVDTQGLAYALVDARRWGISWRTRRTAVVHLKCAHVEQGSLAAEKEEWTTAASHFSSAHQLAPMDPTALFLLAEAEYQIGHYREAADAFERLKPLSLSAAQSRRAHERLEEILNMPQVLPPASGRSFSMGLRESLRSPRAAGEPSSGGGSWCCFM